VTDNEQGKVTIFGQEIGYNMLFGITFLILFILLFFPGMGVAAPK